jgi:hypothetical protein
MNVFITQIETGHKTNECSDSDNWQIKHGFSRFKLLMTHQMEIGPCLAFFALPLQKIFQVGRVKHIVHFWHTDDIDNICLHKKCENDPRIQSKPAKTMSNAFKGIAHLQTNANPTQ